MSQVVRAMGVVQIDSVNVLVRSQELPLFARLGTHDRQAIPKATASGRLFEYWAHAAAHVPTEHHRLWRWKMESKHDGPWEVARDLLRRRRGYIDEVLAQVASDGPVAAGDLSQRTEKKNPWWDWDDAKVALEYLFYCGRVTATRRSSDFARLYDLPERVIPADHLAAPTPNVEDAHRELVHLATKSLGVGTLKDVTDYYRLKQDQVKPRLAELVESGQIVPVSVADTNLVTANGQIIISNPNSLIAIEQVRVVLVQIKKVRELASFAGIPIGCILLEFAVCVAIIGNPKVKIDATSAPLAHLGIVSGRSEYKKAMLRRLNRN
ncbi:MAG: DNA glycosylase AlkZ-like family protein [Ilumatobacteraceae bacterium]